MSDFEIVPIAEIHRRVAIPVEQRLLPLGFECQKPLHWVRSHDRPVRQMFTLEPFKGGIVAPRWGLSLDFVPHVAGSEVKWHRTLKSARLDAVWEARDRAMEFSCIHGPERISRQAPAAMSRALQAAEAFWSHARSLDELPDAFESIRRHLSGGGLGFYNYVQHPLAYAFVLARLGRAAEAEAEMGHYLRPDMKPAVVLRLRQLMAECAVS